MITNSVSRRPSGLRFIVEFVGRSAGSLQGKLIGIFLALSLLPLIVVALLALRSGTEALERSIGGQLEVRARHLGDAVEQALHAGQESLVNWAQLNVMYDIVADDPDGRITGALVTLTKEKTSFGTLLAVNQSGTVVSASEPERIGENVRSAAWFVQTQQATSTNHGSRANLRHDSDGFFSVVPVTAMSRPEMTVGYLVARLTPDRLDRIISGVGGSADDQSASIGKYLLRQDGMVLASIADPSSWRMDPRSFARRLWAEGWQESNKRQGWMVTEDQEVLVGYAEVQSGQEFKWLMVIAQEKSHAFLPVRILSRRIVMVGVLLAGCVILLASLVARRVSAPLQQLIEQARAVAAGNLNVAPLAIARQDEIGLLARTFQHMTDELRSFTAQLEARVEERTKELTHSNEKLEREIGERVRAMQSLHESEERFRLLVEQVRDYAIILLDPDGLVITWNDGARRLKGYEAEEIRGRHVGCFYRKEERDAGKPEELLERARRTGSASDEGWRVRKDGSLFWADVVLTTLRDESGRLRGIAKVTRDVTNQKRAQDELRESRAQLERRTKRLEQSNQELEQFAYVASHDLAEPLRMVSSFCALLKKRYEGRLDKDADEFITYAVDGATRMQRLLQDLLAVSRVSTKQQPLTEVEAEQVFAEMLDNLRVAIRQQGAEITHGALPVVWADRTQLLQVFQNLVGNAIKYHGSAPPRIHCGAVRQNGEWIFSVGDNGIGFDQKHADRIFVIFQRLHSKAEYPGTGVGLSICKKIVERHGGRIWAESTPGVGSTFSFALPSRKEIADGAG